VLNEKMQGARAFVFAAEEDFGIAPVEAQACGTPVIAFGRGGVLETVRTDTEAPTGLFFGAQTVSSVLDAVSRFEQSPGRYTAANCRENAERFSIQRFRDEFSRFAEERLAEFNARPFRPDREAPSDN
jgi:glycosyltransferase involved in cell wall biosynthesis